MGRRKSSVEEPLMGAKGKILITYHKKYPMLSEDFTLPIHVGRASVSITKDGKIDEPEKQWLLENMRI